MHMCFLAFSYQYLHNSLSKATNYLSQVYASEVRGENTPKRKFASTGFGTHNQQVVSQTCSLLNHLGGLKSFTGLTNKLCQKEVVR